jgi:cytochrome c556
MRIAPFVFATCAVLAACGGAETSQANNAQANIANAAVPAATAAASVVTARVSGPKALQVMHERHEAMEGLGKAMKALHRELESSSPFMPTVRAQTSIMVATATKIPAMFPAGTGPEAGKTRAKPEIWKQPDLFNRRSHEFLAAAQAIDAAAKSGDMNKVMALHERVDQACKACHDPFRAPEH